MHMKHRLARRQRGASLLEVLVSILLLSFGMLAMAGLHAASLRYGKMAQFRSVAMQMATDLTDRMRANAAAAVSGSYNFSQAYTSTPPAVTVPACAVPTACTAAEMAAVDLAQWRNQARLALPGAGLMVSQDAAVANVLNVWVMWLDPQAAEAATDGVTLNSQCPGTIGTPNPAPQCMFLRVAL